MVLAPGSWVTRCALVVGSSAAACGDGGGFPDARLPEGPPPGGTFSVAWSVTDTGGGGLSCTRIGGQTVTISVHNINVAGADTEVFGCGSLMGTSRVFPVGKYEMSYELFGSAGLLATAPKQIDVVIESGKDTRLDPVSFAVEAVGGMALRFNTNKPGGNCGAIAADGAGMTGTTIALTHTAGGACEPVTFDVAAGATQPAGSYTVNCAAPTVAPCIENDQVLTVSGVPSDQYLIRVRGLVGGTECWKTDTGFTVPPLMKVLMQTLTLTKQNGC
ncbi:MAG: hypothetical protein KF773_38750 [Deltaproteobacteria bacterium]|nr:hypothetical protein [Deltaproteobacteria bacterium]MCW5804276.1 hypothetical protein [Deltaproteobacteria bacterium]